MKYCTKCVMPDTKPDLYFDEQGVCNACRNFEERPAINWDERKIELLKLTEKYKSENGSNWDCIVPVSGGKDSTFQVIKMLEFGLNPLCVTATTCHLSGIGRRNIENIKHLGVDYVEFSPNPNVRAKLNKIGLTQVGDISWPEHVGIFTIPVRAAVQFGVKLIVWGENSQNEYGGPAADVKNNVLTRRWLEEFGGLLGLRVTDIVGMEGIKKNNLIPYSYPTDEDLQRVGVTGIFLGYYIPWDGYSNALLAQANGFETLQKTVEGSIVNYENLDNHQTGIHDYFKFLKFGFGRATDIACLHLRRGRITREEAIDIVNKHDGKFPSFYLGKPIEQILEPLDITLEEFNKICDRFTNKKIFEKDSRGNLIKDKHGNLKKKLTQAKCVMRVLIIDYGMGNLSSVSRALEECGVREVIISHEEKEFDICTHAILPGVGAFPDAMDNLYKSGLVNRIKELALVEKIPLLGICLGMQLLATEGLENIKTDGLNLIPGKITPLIPQKYERIPHVGWNEIHQTKTHPIFNNIPNESDFYFVHSFQYQTDDEQYQLAYTPYCNKFTSIVAKDNVVGAQFHPEKSSVLGFQFLKNFLEL